VLARVLSIRIPPQTAFQRTFRSLRRAPLEGAGDGGRKNLLWGLLIVLVCTNVESCYVLGEVVWVKVDEGA
jgi:hypothetical protein